ncbi:helix-turn-helix domain-containing protein [Furfurilactobacillus milii]|uniref:Helix-turn-helix domain-containing protein n=1 Tax=Furfurilactobacillus milii TaxID=2888272 RepID=A0A6N9HZE2_9LACO|nr:helix-turn-helix transcriptional regulator [Furfurilactobacillus milii]MYV16050.1 helix-turn-helix domain-containing protein [Furfurilactobacillus milii]
MIDGKRVKITRMKQHVSQRALAEGITSQSTISKLENESVAPNPDVLAQIADRLNLSMSDIVMDNLKSADTLLKDTDLAIGKHEPKRANKYLNQINIDDIYTSHTKLHYLFLKNDINFLLTQDADEAIFNFTRLLDQADAFKSTDSIYTHLAHCQLAELYFSKGNFEATQYYLKLVPKKFSQVEISVNMHWIIYLKQHVAQTLFNLHQYSSSFDYAKQALSLAKKRDTLDLVDSLTFLISLNLSHMNNGWKNIQAEHYLMQAWALAEYTENRELQKKIYAVLNSNELTADFSIQAFAKGSL